MEQRFKQLISALEVFYENALHKFTFDIFDIILTINRLFSQLNKTKQIADKRLQQPNLRRALKN